MLQVNILYVAVTRAKRRLLVNSSLRAFLLVTGAWNSVSLRGVAGRRTPGDGSSSSLSVDEARSSSSSNCNLCGGRADAGGGGNRVDLLSRARAADAQQVVRCVLREEPCRAVTCCPLLIDYRAIAFVMGSTCFHGSICFWGRISDGSVYVLYPR